MACFVCILSALTVFSYARLSVSTAHLSFDAWKPHELHESGEAKAGAVVSMSAHCTKVGIDVLRKGGNAADAVRLTPCYHEPYLKLIDGCHRVLRWRDWYAQKPIRQHIIDNIGRA